MLSLIGGVALGAGLVYFFDREQGRRRRALLGDQIFHVRRVLGEQVEGTSRDLMHRTQGLSHEMGSHFGMTGDEYKSDTGMESHSTHTAPSPSTAESRTTGTQHGDMSSSQYTHPTSTQPMPIPSDEHKAA